MDFRMILRNLTLFFVNVYNETYQLFTIKGPIFIYVPVNENKVINQEEGTQPSFPSQI